MKQIGFFFLTLNALVECKFRTWSEFGPNTALAHHKEIKTSTAISTKTSCWPSVNKTAL